MSLPPFQRSTSTTKDAVIGVSHSYYSSITFIYPTYFLNSSSILLLLAVVLLLTKKDLVKSAFDALTNEYKINCGVIAKECDGNAPKQRSEAIKKAIEMGRQGNNKGTVLICAYSLVDTLVGADVSILFLS